MSSVGSIVSATLDKGWPHAEAFLRAIDEDEHLVPITLLLPEPWKEDFIVALLSMHRTFVMTEAIAWGDFVKWASALTPAQLGMLRKYLPPAAMMEFVSACCVVRSYAESS